jgi:hypothetical protein
MRRNGKTTLTFEAAIARRKKMLAFSRYATLLDAWRLRFGADRVLVAINDDLYSDPQAYLDQITDFIGVARTAVAPKLSRPGPKNTVVTAPRSATLALQANRLRTWLDANRFYRTRTFLRTAGVWRLCSEGGQPFAPLDPATRAFLCDLLRPEIERLEDMLGRDLSKWKGVSAETRTPAAADA